MEVWGRWRSRPIRDDLGEEFTARKNSTMGEQAHRTLLNLFVLHRGLYHFTIKPGHRGHKKGFRWHFWLPSSPLRKVGPPILAQFENGQTLGREMDLGKRLRQNRIRPNPADHNDFTLLWPSAESKPTKSTVFQFHDLARTIYTEASVFGQYNGNLSCKELWYAVKAIVINRRTRWRGQRAR